MLHQHVSDVQIKRCESYLQELEGHISCLACMPAKLLLSQQSNCCDAQACVVSLQDSLRAFLQTQRLTLQLSSKMAAGADHIYLMKRPTLLTKLLWYAHEQQSQTSVPQCLQNCQMLCEGTSETLYGKFW